MGALNLPTIASGQLQPYQTSNDADAAVESAMTDELSVDLTSGNHTLTQAEFTRSIYFAATGNSVPRTLTTPATNRLFVVHNGGSDTLTLETGSTTLTIAAGDTGIFYTDGTTNGLSAIVASTGATGAAGGDLTGTYPNPTIGAGKVSLAKMANLAANSVIGNNTGSAATPIALTMAQLKTLLALVVADVSGAAPLASPTFTGAPLAPTPTGGDNTTKLATTAFVQSALAGGTGPTGSAGGDLTGTYPNPTIAAAAVTLAKMANLAASSILGNNTGSPATPIALTASQVKTLLAIATGDVSGLAASATTDTTDASNISSGTLAAARLAAIRYDLATFYPGVPGSSQLVLRWQAPRAVTIPSGGTNSQASAGTAATASTTFTIKQNGSSVGTIVWSAAGTAGAFTISSTINIAAGDVITITGPASADATIADIAITLAGTA